VVTVGDFGTDVTAGADGAGDGTVAAGTVEGAVVVVAVHVTVLGAVHGGMASFPVIQRQCGWKYRFSSDGAERRDAIRKSER
jgi:hypothetical protein